MTLLCRFDLLRFGIVCSLCFAACCVACFPGSVSAQDSRLNSIIAEYKRRKQLADNERKMETALSPGANGQGANSWNANSYPPGAPRPPRQERLRNPFQTELAEHAGVEPVQSYGVRQVGFGQNMENGNGFHEHREQRADARLYDLCFVTPHRGWAVGDHGAIWSTNDAGRTWQAQESGVDCPLKSVFFLNENEGIIVGGAPLPFLKSTWGIILKTDDGGASWTRVSDRNIPALHRVQMESPLHGWAVGVPCEFSPSGILFTSDGGRSWGPFPVPAGFASETWKDFRFLDPQVGFGVTLKDSLYFLRGSLAPSRHPDLGTRQVRAIEWVTQTPPQAPSAAWLVGKGGLVLKSEDQGATWTAPPGRLNELATQHVDFETVFAAGTKIHLAGSPGTRIFSSEDSGRTWKSVPSGIGTPIRKIHFLNERQGYALGDLGTIIATFDGGATWNVQRSGGARVTLLGVFARAEEIPYEVFAQYCADQGFLGAVELPFQESEGESLENGMSWKDRVHEALTRCGVSASNQGRGFQLQQRVVNESVETLLNRIERDNGGEGLNRLRWELVAMIRTWRPNVVLCPAPGESADAVRELLARELREAIEIAKDPKAYPEQLQQLGLVPWKVDKFVQTLERNKPGDFNVTTTAYAERLGKPLNEITFQSRGLIDPRPLKWPRSIGMEAIHDAYSHYNGLKNDLMNGIVISPGVEARRIPLPSPFLADAKFADINRRIALRRQQLVDLCEKHARRSVTQNNQPFERDPGGGNVNIYALAREMVGEMDPEVAVQILLELGLRFRDYGDWNSAESMFSLMSESYPQNPLSAAGMVWMVQYGSSPEVQWKLQRKTLAFDETEIDSQERPQGRSETAKLAEEQRLRVFRQDMAIQSRDLLKQYVPNEISRPELRFSIASIQKEKDAWAKRQMKMRQMQDGQEPVSPILQVSGATDPLKKSAVKIATSFPGSQPFRALWSKRAMLQQWAQMREESGVTEMTRDCPFPSLTAKLAHHPPYLDGRFDETFDKDVWLAANVQRFSPILETKNVPQIALVSAGATSPQAVVTNIEQNVTGSKPLGTQMMILYDEHCLYLALRCKKSDRFTYQQPDNAPRPRDPELAKEDRVEILLDLDRDYGIAYKLTIDHRGWVRDECWNDASWNPALFVARDEDANHWMIEAAIPFESLVDFAPESGDIWGIALRRIVPDEGIECWNAEHSENLDNGYGFLLFE